MLRGHVVEVLRSATLCVVIACGLIGAPRAAPFAYVTNSGNDTVSVIDTALVGGSSEAVSVTVGVGDYPHGIAVNATGTLVFVTNINDQTVSVIGTSANHVVATIPVAGRPWDVAVHPDGKRAYVTTQNTGTTSNSLLVITVNTTIPFTFTTLTVPMTDNPSSVVVHPDGMRVYVIIGGGQISEVNADTNEVTRTVSIEGTEGISASGIAVHPDGTRIYVTNRGLYVFYLYGYRVVRAGDLRSFSTISLERQQLISLGEHPAAIAINRAGTLSYVVQSGGHDLFDGIPPDWNAFATAPTSIIDTINDSFNAYTSTQGLGASDVAVTPSDSHVYVVNAMDQEVVVMDAGGSLVTKIQLNSPVRVAIGPDVPGAPTNVEATPTLGGGRVTVTFTPVSNPPAAGYTVICTPSGAPWTGEVQKNVGANPPITVDGLVNGQTYSCTVQARNGAGFGPPSEPVTVTPARRPDPPQIVEVTPGNGQATFTIAPGFNGGSTITGYTVTCQPGPVIVPATGSPVTVMGLTNGVTYTCTATTTNAFGPSWMPSMPVSVTPATVPGAPTNVSVTPGPGSGQVTVTFAPPASNGGSSIAEYIVICDPGGHLERGSGTSLVVSNLVNDSYDCTVRARNGMGPGLPSASVPATPATPPGPPRNVHATAGNGAARITFTEPASDGGLPVSYVVTCNPGGHTASGMQSPIVVPGLNNGTTFTCRVTASNSAGESTVRVRVRPEIFCTFFPPWC